MNKIHSIETNRKIISCRRKSPTNANCYNLIIHHDGAQQWMPDLTCTYKTKSVLPVPTNIYIYISEHQPNNSHSESLPSAKWDISSWLKYALRQWADSEITIKFISFDYALIKTNLLGKLDILKSEKHNWKVSLISDGKEFANTAVIDEILKMPLDYIEVYPCGFEANEINFRTLEAVKNLVDLRELRRQNQPAIICKFTIDEANETQKIENLKQWVKQTGIDKLVIRKKQSEESELWDL